MKYHRDAPLRRRDAGEIAAVQADGAAVGALETRNDPQQRGLARAARSENNEQFAVAGGKRNAVERGSTAPCVAVNLDEVSGYE